MNNAEVTETVKACLVIEVSVDLERATSANLGQLLDDLLVLGIQVHVAREELASVEHDTVRLEFVI